MDTFFRLIDKLNRLPEDERAHFEEMIWDTFGVERTVLVSDMSGFSSTVRRFGLVHFLGMIRRMTLTSEPIIRDCGGEVVKFEADNIFAVFESPREAVEASVAMNQAFARLNEKLPDSSHIFVSVGIDHGRFLLLGPDLFGDPLNVASKLGEDLAGPSEILISEGAYERCLPNLPYSVEPVELQLSNLNLRAHRLLYSLER